MKRDSTSNALHVAVVAFIIVAVSVPLQSKVTESFRHVDGEIRDDERDDQPERLAEVEQVGIDRFHRVQRRVVGPEVLQIVVPEAGPGHAGVRPRFDVGRPLRRPESRRVNRPEQPAVRFELFVKHNVARRDVVYLRTSRIMQRASSLPEKSNPNGLKVPESDSMTKLSLFNRSLCLAT